MKAFEFDHRLINSYARFSRSFSTIRSEDLKSEVGRQYDAGRFWPDALLSLNPRYLEGPTVDDLVASGDLDEATGRIFRFGETPLRFHRHHPLGKRRHGSKKGSSDLPSYQPSGMRRENDCGASRISSPKSGRRSQLFATSRD
jgi:hypothetical protein